MTVFKSKYPQLVAVKHALVACNIDPKTVTFYVTMGKTGTLRIKLYGCNKVTINAPVIDALQNVAIANNGDLTIKQTPYHGGNTLQGAFDVVLTFKA